MKHVKSVGGIIFREEDGKKYFLLLNAERMTGERGKHTFWDFPKGHMEKDETEVHTMFRETQEETGINDLRVLEGFRETIKYFFTQEGALINKEVIFLLCETKTKEVKISSEHLDYAWLEYGEAFERLTFKNSKQMLTKAHEFMGRRKKLTEW